MSKKIEAGGRRVTADLAPDVIKKMDTLRVKRSKNGIEIMSITRTLEQIIRKSNGNIWI